MTTIEFPQQLLDLRVCELYFRWELALPEFRCGLNLVIAGSYNRATLYWPGHDKEIIPETLPGELKVKDSVMCTKKWKSENKLRTIIINILFT